VQTVAEDEIAAVVNEAHRHNGDLATEDDLGIIAEAGMPIAPVLTSPWIGVEHAAAARGFGDRVRDRLRMQLDTSFQMIRNARARGIPVLSGSDTGSASAFAHGRWHGKEAELFVKEVGMTPMEAILANTSRNAAMVNLAGEVGVIALGKLADIVIWARDPIADITVQRRSLPSSRMAG
jgi:imidazolonepropionase-like amidohydrolase